jgi:hypothetical protein
LPGHLARIHGTLVAIDVRMPPYEFLGQLVRHVFEAEVAAFRHDFTHVQNLEQHVTQLFAQIVGGSAQGGMGGFVGFFDHIGNKVLKLLCGRPWATFWAPKMMHNGRYTGKRLGGNGKRLGHLDGAITLFSIWASRVG